MTQKEARYFTVVAGIWLFVSAFIWPHSRAQFTNTWTMGVVTTAAALGSLWMPAVRLANTAIGFWLVISAFLLPFSSRGTLLNNVLVGFAVLGLSLVGPLTGPRGTMGSGRPLDTSA